MKKYDAYLCGYYGMRNSGDDALMYATAWGAKHYLNAKSVKISSQSQLHLPDFGMQQPILKAHQRFSGQNRLAHYCAALTSKRVVFGGGSVLHNAHDIKMKTDMMRLSGGRGHLGVGIGIGPFKDKDAETACAQFLERCSFVGVRDQESFAIARSIAPNANVHLTFDLAPLLLQRKDFSLQPIPRKGIAVNLCPVGKFGGQTTLDHRRLTEIALALELIAQQTGEAIELIDINGHPTEGDFPLHNQLAAMLGDTVKISQVEYDSNPLRLLQRLSGYKAIISMRLHGAILGYLAGTPVMAINYHSKCWGWCNQIGLHQNYQFNAERFSGECIAAEIIDGLAYGFKPAALTPQQSVQLALTNWSKSHESSTQRFLSRYSFI